MTLYQLHKCQHPNKPIVTITLSLLIVVVVIDQLTHHSDAVAQWSPENRTHEIRLTRVTHSSTQVGKGLSEICHRIVLSDKALSAT